MVCYVHSVPGRLRVRIPAAKGNPATAAKLVNRLNVLEGITSVTANAITGSIVIHYEGTTTDAAACLAVLDVQAMRTDTPAGAGTTNMSQPGSRLLSKIFEAATWYLFESLLERCFPLILAALF